VVKLELQIDLYMENQSVDGMVFISLFHKSRRGIALFDPTSCTSAIIYGIFGGDVSTRSAKCQNTRGLGYLPSHKKMQKVQGKR
jgi:hypothetical protein